MSPNRRGDPWAWAAVAAILPVVLHSLGAPLGEPFMDDFDYLHRALLEPRGSFFDGYGSVLYWRPLARQIYFGLLTKPILALPALVPILHGACLALTSWLLYRAARVSWPGAVAAAMGGFVLLMESARMLLAWPSHFMDLGAVLCAALAIHEAAHDRWPTSIAAMAGSLLSKEIGLATALLVPWLPAAARGRGVRARIAPTAAMLGMLAVWGAIYGIATRVHHLSLPHEFEPATNAAPWFGRYAWALWHSARAAFSLSPSAGAAGLLVAGGVIAIAIACAVRFAIDREARTRLRGARAWIAWGMLWFLAASATLTEVYPAWAPYRAVFAGIGFGVAVTAAVASAHAWALAALVALRLAAFAASPGPPAVVTVLPPETGAVYDFAHLVRLERMVRETRELLAARWPSLPRGAAIVRHGSPHMTDYAFSGPKAIQVWYRDTTLRWVSFESFRRDTALVPAAIIEWQPVGSHPLATVAPAAMRALIAASDRIAASSWTGALAALGQADSLQRDPDARLFFGTVASKRALCLVQAGSLAAAEDAAREGMRQWPENPDSRYALAQVRLRTGRPEQAEAELDTLLALYPDDRGAWQLRDYARRKRAESGR